MDHNTGGMGGLGAGGAVAEGGTGGASGQSATGGRSGDREDAALGPETSAEDSAADAISATDAGGGIDTRAYPPFPADYQGTPFIDPNFYPTGGPQAIPGQVKFAYYDLGGPTVAYLPLSLVQHGSGVFNTGPTPLDQFRAKEHVSISYTKSCCDKNPYNMV